MDAHEATGPRKGPMIKLWHAEVHRLASQNPHATKFGVRLSSERRPVIVYAYRGKVDRIVFAGHDNSAEGDRNEPLWERAQ